MNRFPAIFIGHGSPYNLFDQNEFTRSLNSFGKRLFSRYKPAGIIIISAHWLTRNTYLTGNDKPRMIYDYYGFPKNFYEYVYPAKGSSEIAQEILDFCPNELKTTNEWGIDHAATIVLENIIPSGKFPVFELSLDMRQEPQFHFDLGQKLSILRESGFLLIGSGNLIHTFREFNWNVNAEPFKWVIELDEIQKKALDSRDLEKLINYELIELNRRGFQTNDHYLPMLYILGMQQDEEEIHYIFEGVQHASISHRSFYVGDI